MQRIIDRSSPSSLVLRMMLIFFFVSSCSVNGQTTPDPHHTSSPSTVSPSTGQPAPIHGDGTLLSPQPQSIVLNGTSIHRLKLFGSGPAWQEMNGVGAVIINAPTNAVDDGSKIAWMNIRLNNAYSQPTLLHTHGQTPNYLDDGVEYFSRPALKPTESLNMSFAVTAGTHFMHGHVGWQLDEGLAVPLIIRAPLPADYPNAVLINAATDVLYVIEDVCLLSMEEHTGHSSSPHSSCADPTVVFKGLQVRWNQMKASFDNNQCQGGDLSKRWNNGISSETMKGLHSEMEVMYRYVAVNGRGIENPISVFVSPSQTIRLRIINTGSMMDFNVSFGSLPTPTLIAVDGHLIQPLRTNSLWLAVGQRADVIITIPENPSSSYLIAAVMESGNQPALQGGIVLYTTPNPPPPGTFPPVSVIGSGFGTISGIDLERELRAWKPLPPRAADREYTIRMGGQYGFDSFSGAAQPYLLPPLLSDGYTKNSKALQLKEGERVCITFINLNEQTHPMHLHGHVFQVTEINGQSFQGAVRDTVLVGGGCQSAKVCFDANNPGTHAMHCHMSFHMMAGMFTTVEYGAVNHGDHSDASPLWPGWQCYSLSLGLLAINIFNRIFQ